MAFEVISPTCVRYVDDWQDYNSEGTFWWANYKVVNKRSACGKKLIRTTFLYETMSLKDQARRAEQRRVLNKREYNQLNKAVGLKLKGRTLGLALRGRLTSISFEELWRLVEANQREADSIPVLTA